MKFHLKAALAAIIVSLPLMGCHKKSDDAVHLGAIVSLSGPAAAYGEDNRRGLELALAAINEKGIAGRKLVLDIQDSAGDNAQAVTLSRRFADDPQTLAILGPTRTGETVAVSKILPSIQIAMMSVGSTGDWSSAGGAFNPWTFRSTRVDTYLIEPLLRVARDRFGVKTVAMISTANDDYAVSVRPVYTRAAAALGLKLVADEVQMTGDTDRTAQLTRIKAARPDALIINTLSSDAPVIASQARRAGITSRFIGTAGFSSPATFKLAGADTLEGTLTADNFFMGSAAPQVADFVQRYRRAYKANPPAYAAYAYDGLRVVADAIARSGAKPTRQAVRDALASTKDFPGVLGTLTYKGPGDAAKPAVILVISQGQYRLVS
jgi:branched-chain amino acid transport system substrate-binding protein